MTATVPTVQPAAADPVEAASAAPSPSRRAGRVGAGKTPRRAPRPSPQTPDAPAPRQSAPTPATAQKGWRSRIGLAVTTVLKPSRVVSPLGWGILLSAVVALALALVFGWIELLAVAAIGILALLFAIPFVLGRTAYQVGVELASPRVVVGEPAVGRVVVRNTSRRPSPATRIELPVGRVTAEFRMPRLAPDAEHDELFQIPTHRRAVLTLGPVTSVRTDPLGLLRREVGWTEPTELYVHPRVVPLAGETTGLLRDLEGLPTRDLADDDVSFHALREYSPGDDLRYVHWKSTARTQTLMIRQFEQTRRSHLVVVLSTRAAEYSGDDEFELAVSTAGSIGLTALRDGKNVTVLTSRGTLPAPTPTQLLDRLAGVEREDSASSTEAVARTVAKATPGASVVTFVTGSTTSIAELRSASVRVPATARSTALRAADGGELARRAIGDLVVVDVPDLASLRLAMRGLSA